MIKVVTDFLTRKHNKRAAESEIKDSFPEHLLKSARNKRYTKVELAPASVASYALWGPCTAVKIYYPGDSGPAIHFYHVLIAPSDWTKLPYSEIQRIARVINVETADLAKAVDKLCGVR